MGDKPTGDKHIIEYLLGALPADETERLDELSFSDDEFAGRLRAVENDLVDAYVRGELAGDLRTRFESNYMSTPMRRQRIAFARSLATAVNRAPLVDAGREQKRLSAPSAASPGVKRDFGGWFRLAPRLAWGLAAATVLLLAASAWLVSERRKLVNQALEASAVYDGLRKREQELQEQLALQRLSDAEKQKELEDIRTKLAELESQRTQRENTAKEPTFVAFTLAPQMRGVSDLQPIILPRGTEQVALRLELERGDFAYYRAELKSLADSRSVLKTGQLRARGGGDVRILSMRIQAGLLKDQMYIVEVTGFSSNGDHEVCGTYAFKIVRSN